MKAQHKTDNEPMCIGRDDPEMFMMTQELRKQKRLADEAKKRRFYEVYRKDIGL